MMRMAMTDYNYDPHSMASWELVEHYEESNDCEEVHKCPECNENEVDIEGQVCTECWYEFFHDDELEVVGHTALTNDLYYI